jgi:hypothetical protein
MSGGSAGDKRPREVSTDGLSDDDERAAYAALVPKEFLEEGDKNTHCVNFLICNGYAKETRIQVGPDRPALYVGLAGRDTTASSFYQGKSMT